MQSSPAWQIRVQAEPFEVGEELQQLQQATPQAGAVVNFLGLVRDQFSSGSATGTSTSATGLNPAGQSHDGQNTQHQDRANLVYAMQIEHYPGMTEKALQGIAAQAAARWPLLGLRIIHRYGRLEAGAPIVWVATSSLHRQAAFEACAFVMDYLKTDAPFWKKEIGHTGEQWVEARAADEHATQQWKLTP